MSAAAIARAYLLFRKYGLPPTQSQQLYQQLRTFPRRIAN